MNLNKSRTSASNFLCRVCFLTGMIAIAAAGMLPGTSIGAELSLNGFVPVVSEADGHGWSAGIPVGGFLPGPSVDLYAGYWEPVMRSDIPPHIATNALIYPSAGSVLQPLEFFNITWDPQLITDDIDGTNLIITSITVHRSNDLSQVGIAATNVLNGYGSYPWYIPIEMYGGPTTTCVMASK